MPSARPPSVADLLAGGDKLRDLFEVVGMVVTNFGGTEETLQYLDWQLQAYDLAVAMPAGTPENDVQLALMAPRAAYFGKHHILSNVLRSIDNGFAYPSITAALGTDAANVSAEWQAFKATAKDLGNRRNAFAHSAIGISGMSPVRSMGLNAPVQTVNTADDINLNADIASFRMSLGAFINKLDRDLPFRDHNTVTFFEASV